MIDKNEDILQRWFDISYKNSKWQRNIIGIHKMWTTQIPYRTYAIFTNVVVLQEWILYLLFAVKIDQQTNSLLCVNIIKDNIGYVMVYYTHNQILTKKKKHAHKQG